MDVCARAGTQLYTHDHIGNIASRQPKLAQNYFNLIRQKLCISKQDFSQI